MANNVSYQRAAVQPMECLSSGFALLRDRYWLLFGISAVGMLIGSVVPLGILLGPMMCGIYLAFLEHMRGRQIEFGTLFKGFDYFKESLIATLLFIVPMMVLIIPFYLFFMVGMISLTHTKRGGGNPPPEMIGSIIGLSVLLVLAVIIISMVLGVCFAFTYPLIVDRRLSAIDALKTSFKAGLANFWRLLGLILLNALLGLVGAIFCYIGAFFLMPVQFAALAIAYRQVFGLAPDQATAPPPAIT